MALMKFEEQSENPGRGHCVSVIERPVLLLSRLGLGVLLGGAPVELLALRLRTGRSRGFKVRNLRHTGASLVSERS